MPGQPLPDPVIQDDRERLPVEVVTNVLRWLTATKPAFDNKPPTPMRIELGPGINARQKAQKPTAKVVYQTGAGVREEFQFRHHTVEFLLKDERLGLVARYRYLAASDEQNRTIVGPQLRILQDSRLSISA